MGFTSADVEYIREKSLAFKNKIEEPGKVTQTHRPESVKAMFIAFEQGIAVGIAKVRGLPKARKNWFLMAIRSSGNDPNLIREQYKAAR